MGHRHHHRHHHKHHQRSHHRHFRISRFWISFLLAIASFFLVLYFSNGLTLLIQFVCWTYFSFRLYKKSFRKINRVWMGSDLSAFGMRIIAGLIIFASILIFIFIFASLALTSIFSSSNTSPYYIPLITLLGGLFLMGVFMLFRTNRRHNLIGVWKA